MKTDFKNNTANEKEYSSTTYKIASISAFIWGIITLLFTLVLLIVAPLMCLITGIFCILCFKTSRKFKKKAKQLEK